MAYRRNFRQAHPKPRDMITRFAGKCACCGAPIGAGEWATYYPAGTAGSNKGCIAHVGGLDGTGTTCFVELRKQHDQAAVNDHAGDGLDSRYEDQCAEICGL